MGALYNGFGPILLFRATPDLKPFSSGMVILRANTLRKSNAQIGFHLSKISVATLVALVLFLVALFNDNDFILQSPVRTAARRIHPRNREILFNHSFIANGSRTSRRVVIVTASTFQFFHFVRNLQCSVKAATGMSSVLLALDNEAERLANFHEIPVINILRDFKGLENSDKPYKYHTEGFILISHLKSLVVRHVLSAGIDVLFSDVDVVWCSNAAERIVTHMERDNFGDILFQNDRPTEATFPFEANTGFFYAKSTVGVLKLFDEWIKVSLSGRFRHVTQQISFKLGICGDVNRIPKILGGKKSFACVWNNQTNVEILPLYDFPNGNSPLGIKYEQLERGRLRQACANKQIAIYHNNWVSGVAKIARMNEENLWTFDNATEKCLPLK